MFSDGYTDQFGGEKGKKFKFRRFRHLLLTIHNRSFDSQKELLENAMNSWKRDLEQVDDILVIGFKPLGREGLFETVKKEIFMRYEYNMKIRVLQ